VKASGSMKLARNGRAMLADYRRALDAGRSLAMLDGYRESIAELGESITDMMNETTEVAA
jgi:hypothetical protein